MNEVQIDKRIFSIEAQKCYNDIVFNNIYRDYNISGEHQVIKERIQIGEKIVKKRDGREIKEPIYDSKDYKGFPIKDDKTKKTYFIQDKDIVSFPLRIRQSRELVYNKKVFQLVTESEPVIFPENDSLPFDVFFDNWMNINHSSKEDLEIAKFLVLTAGLTNNTSRILTPRAFGKTGLAGSLIQVTGRGKIIPPKEISDVKIGQCILEDYTMYDEISGFGGKMRDIFENFFLVTADGTNSKYEHPTSGSNKSFSTYDITKYGYNIMHNPPESYMNQGKECFEQMFRVEVFDRLFCIELFGQVQEDKDFDAYLDWYSFVKEHIQEYRAWVSKFYYLKNHFNELVLTKDITTRYDWKYSPSASCRFIKGLKKIAKVVELRYPDDESFYKVFDLIYKRHKDYINRVKEMGLIIDE